MRSVESRFSSHSSRGGRVSAAGPGRRAIGHQYGQERGFSLVEVLIAVALLAMVSLGVAQLFAAATQANFAAKSQTSTALLAVQKMEQLRALAWGYDQQLANLGLPLSDTVTDVSVEPSAAGGTGLNPSPGGTLTANTPPYVDYCDASGVWVGNGAVAPANAFYVRRWSITPLPTNPNNTLIFQVRVTTVRQAQLAVAGAGTVRRIGNDTWLVSVKTRKAQ
jgi:prepilin-type N-terminal cleavage/methylation domain-containing protein